MKTTSKITALALLGTLAASALSPVLADPGSQQKNKNQWRNLGIVGAAVAGYGLLKHNQTATILGAAGAAYSANRYEQDRHSQSQDSANRNWYHRGSNGYNYNNGYNNNGYNYNTGSGYPTNGYGNGRSYGNGGNGYGSGDGRQYQAFRRQDNGKHKGWYKKHTDDNGRRGDEDGRHGDDNGD